MTPLSEVNKAIQTNTNTTVTYLVLAADPETYYDCVRNLDALYFSSITEYMASQKALLTGALRKNQEVSQTKGRIDDGASGSVTI